MPMPGDQHRDTPATVNPFVPVVPHVSEWTAKEIATLQSRLDKQLGPEYISTRPGAGGGKVHYLAAEKVINLANEVFGFNGWSSSIQNVQIDFVDESTTTGKITLGLSTIVRVTLRDGSYHEDIGYGHIENCKGKAAAFEKAKKEAATDALKRALRNFGNLLGNCLYDKDYLQKVTKVKVAPSRWDVANLHHHPDYAPDNARVKREALAQQSEKREQPQTSNGEAPGGPKRMTSAQSNGSAEFGDEDFDGNLFEDTDFSHPDEVRLDDSAQIESPPHRAVNDQRQGVPRTTSMPQLRPPNVQPPQPLQNVQQPQRLQSIQRPGNNVGQQQTNRMLPPQTPGHQQRAQYQPNGGQPVHTNLDGGGARSNHSSAEASDGHGQQGAGSRPAELPGNIDGSEMPMPQEPPPDAPTGFITGRAAGALNQPAEARPPTAAIAFNPHAESPSIRRTLGVNPGKSAPVNRQLLEENLRRGPNTGHPNNMPYQQQPQTNGLNGAAAPVRTNFVNPAADPHRRIGMPGGGGMQNRSAYKPPSAVKRPALADVSNLPQVDGGSDTKRAKLDTPQAQQVSEPGAGEHVPT